MAGSSTLRTADALATRKPATGNAASDAAPSRTRGAVLALASSRSMAEKIQAEAVAERDGRDHGGDEHARRDEGAARDPAEHHGALRAAERGAHRLDRRRREHGEEPPRHGRAARRRPILREQQIARGEPRDEGDAREDRDGRDQGREPATEGDRVEDAAEDGGDEPRDVEADAAESAPRILAEGVAPERPEEDVGGTADSDRTTGP